jgi:hypothetical protein
MLARGLSTRAQQRPAAARSSTNAAHIVRPAASKQQLRLVTARAGVVYLLLEPPPWSHSAAQRAGWLSK